MRLVDCPISPIALLADCFDVHKSVIFITHPNVVISLVVVDVVVYRS